MSVNRDIQDEDFGKENPGIEKKPQNELTNNVLSIVVVACIGAIIVSLTIRLVTWILP